MQFNSKGDGFTLKQGEGNYVFTKEKWFELPHELNAYSTKKTMNTKKRITGFYGADFLFTGFLLLFLNRSFQPLNVV
jgi:hypothetical protein